MTSCFSIGWAEQLCIWLVIIFAVFAVIRLVMPYLTSLIGSPLIVGIINIVLWAIVAIMAIKVIFMLFSCILSGPGGFLH
jgi:hypothetical protein